MPNLAVVRLNLLQTMHSKITTFADICMVATHFESSCQICYSFYIVYAQPPSNYVCQTKATAMKEH